MKKLRVLFLLLLPLFSTAQNLVANGGFEDENFCAEFNIACAPAGWLYTVPSFMYYFKEPARAHGGSKFVGLIAGHASKPFYRTFVRSRLLCGLRAGHQYTLEFYIKSRHGFLKNVGVLFTPYDFLFQRTPYRELKPSLTLVDAAIAPIRGDSSWQKITLAYTARGDEAFLTMGYFGGADLTGPTGLEKEANYYFFIDDVWLLPVDVHEKLCTDWPATRDAIYAQTERHEYLKLLIFNKKKAPVEIIHPTLTAFQKIDTLLVPDVWFATGSAALKNKTLPLLDSLCSFSKHHAVDSLVIEGHTDSTGQEAANQTLGESRAQSVAAYLHNCVSLFPIVTRSWGSVKPVASNKTPAGRQRNRRVQLYLYVRAQGFN